MTLDEMEVNITANIVDESSEYAKTRRRLYNQYHRDLSDKEIIEELCNEINNYTLKNKTPIHYTEETTLYADGKPIKKIIEYKYKYAKEVEIKG